MIGIGWGGDRNWLVFSLCNSSILFVLQILIASHKQFSGFSVWLRVLGLVSQEYDVLVFGL